MVRGTIEEFLYTDAGRNRNRFSLGTSLVYLNELGIGNESTFEGLFFPYFGPYFENLALYSREGFCDNIKLGGQLSLLQTNLQAGFMLSRYEFFAAWKVLSFSNTSKNNACHFGNFHGFTIGTRVYFSL